MMSQDRDGGDQERLEKLRPSRAGALWAGSILAAVLLALLLVFVAQNSQTVTVSFLWFTGHVPLGVALLLAAIGGVLVVAVPGTVRIVQLRRLATGHQTRRQAKAKDGRHRKDQGPDAE